MDTLLSHLQFPEGPAFDREGRIWLVEKDAGNLICLREGECYRYATGGAPNGIAIDQKNLIWFCDSKNNSIRTFDPALGILNTLVDQIGQVPLKMPNDLAFDSRGNLLFTCPGDRLDDGTGYICCLAAGGSLNVVHQGMFYPNGLAFSKNNRILYVAETGTHFLWKFDWNQDTACLSNPRKWKDVGGVVGPDGLAISDEGHVYVAVYGAGHVKQLDAEGNTLADIKTRGLNPTNCAIDPDGEKGLMITEAEKGELLRIPLKTKGVIYPF